MVKAVVPKGKNTGTYIGRVAIRTSGSFNLKTDNGTIQGVSYRYCRLLQHTDGYNYKEGGTAQYEFSSQFLISDENKFRPPH